MAGGEGRMRWQIPQQRISQHVPVQGWGGLGCRGWARTHAHRTPWTSLARTVALPSMLKHAALATAGGMWDGVGSPHPWANAHARVAAPPPLPHRVAVASRPRTAPHHAGSGGSRPASAMSHRVRGRLAGWLPARACVPPVRLEGRVEPVFVVHPPLLSHMLQPPLFWTSSQSSYFSTPLQRCAPSVCARLACPPPPPLPCTHTHTRTHTHARTCKLACKRNHATLPPPHTHPAHAPPVCAAASGIRVHPFTAVPFPEE